MGQPIVVVEKPSVANPGVVRFETNRAITGMGHERYVAGTEVRGNRPPDELARRLLAFPSVHAVHINGSVVTVDLAKGMTTAGLKEVIEGLYIHYPATSADEVADADAPESEGEAVEQAAAAPADVAPDPKHTEPETVADTVVADAATPGPDEAAEAPAASSSDAVAEPGEETEADVQAAEGDAPTEDVTPVGGTPSDPPADDTTSAPTPDA